ncbi:hypothetical protein KKG90_05885 [Candidatus Bipolaricaulota bacterium]|nr:hypothetical protein [Candidatus Bipolaricaulota bacterium]
MQQGNESDGGLSVARITIETADWQDAGIGIVIARRPLTLLVPSHLIELVEQEPSARIQINGVVHDRPKILPVPALQRDYLSVLQFSAKHRHDLSSAQLPRKGVPLATGQPILLQRLAPESSTSGTVVDIREQGDGSSIITDIRVSQGDSGSPLMVHGQLAAVCQGMVQREGIGSAVAVPLSHDSLAELRRLKRRYRVNVISSLIAALIALTLAFGGFALYSATFFSLASIEVPEDGSMIIARNADALTLRPTWSRSYGTPIRRFEAFSSQAGGELDRVAVGTGYQDGQNGAFHLLDGHGKTLWSYSVPDGECIYSTETEVYDGFLVDVIYISDVNRDGAQELFVVFVHDHHESCKLAVFDLSGNLLAEYWHPGYIRSLTCGQVGEAEESLVVLTASNNAIKTEWWNPQTVFAFRGLDIAGQGPPYVGSSEKAGKTFGQGTEIWYCVIVNSDPERIRAKCAQLDIRDFDGDGVNEIQAALTDSRFYYLDDSGNQIGVALGDHYYRDFPGVDPPALVDIWTYYDPHAVGD